MKCLLFCLSLLFVSTESWAVAEPQGSRFDGRMQQVIYNSQNVTVVNTKAGFMTTLVFAEDEAVLDARAGFNEAWEARPDSNRVYLRPVALVQGAPGEDGNAAQVVIPPNSKDWHTNLFIVTNKRFYNVELNVIDDKSRQQPAFQVTYRYPQEDKKKVTQEAVARSQAWLQRQEKNQVEQMLRTAQSPRNWDYWMRTGQESQHISPDFVYDDGRFTFLGFSPQKAIPSLFRYQNGKEQVVNSSVQRKGNYTVLVIHELIPQLVLRSGDAVLGIENRRFGQIQAVDGTTISPRVERVLKVK
ncbi:MULTISPECIES: P-type conjugative transfer protein VirB9 [Arsenophonus]|uniref:P-type conjugative transfer protein VirB9 n=1 Tax=Arsenophonus TaxID=637 RepID=UPI00387A2EA6